jgi:hypothetical protein
MFVMKPGVTHMSALILTMASACDEARAAAPQADFNGDGRADLAIGVPLEDVNDQVDAGAVAVIYGKSTGLNQAGDQFWNAESPGIKGVASAGANFGSALAVGDFDGDGFSDLAIGIQLQSVAGVAGAGAVEIIYGSATGLTSAHDQRWTRASDGLLGDPSEDAMFGATLVAGDFNDDGRDDLAIGVIGQQVVAGQQNGGEVHILYGTPSGLSAADDQIFNQLTTGIHGEPELGDNFGFALSAADFDGDGFADLAIAIPGDTVDTFNEAGAVEVIYGSDSGLRANGAQFIAQGLDGLQNGPDEDNAFGFALATGDFDHDGRDDLAISVPAEEVGGDARAGAVHVLYGTADGLDTVDDQFWSQETSSVQDFAEPDDQFGFSLATGDFDNDGFDDLAIGAVQEAIGVVEKAGAVNVLYGTGNGLIGARNQFWHQNSDGILDDVEEFDLFGVRLSVGDYDNDGFDDLVVAVFAEDINGPENNDGAVHIICGRANGLHKAGNQFWHQDSQGILDTAELNDVFGLAVR